MKLIVGLGNPGPKYSLTRHNTGFLVLDAYLSNPPWKEDHKSLLYRRDETLFCKPLTFMNLSGEAVSSIKNFFKLSNQEILVIYDDLYLAEGTFRLSTNRSSGGHNGIKNLIEKLGGKDFLTLRIGIGPREKADSISDYVLTNFNNFSLNLLTSIYPQIFDAIRDFEEGATISELQNKHNK